MKRARLGVLLAGLLLASSGHAIDGPMGPVLTRLLESSPKIKASASDVESAQARADEAHKRSWTPNLDLSLEAGKQRYESQASRTPPTLGTDRASLRITQLLTDFGRSAGQIGEARAVEQQAAAVASATRDGVLLEALTAHWSVVRADRTLEYARQSEASVRGQAALESSMVELGKGYESNVLQAKVQLATAEARRIRAEGALDIANARIGAVFGAQAGKVTYSDLILPIPSKLPKTLDEARELALQNNQQIQIGLFRSRAIQQRLGATDAREFRPRLQLVGEHSARQNIDAAAAGPHYGDNKVMLQLQYSFNAGLAGVAARDTVKRDFEASTEREQETRDLVIEQVTIAWRNLRVAQQNKETLANQVRIAAKFFEMATAERKIGRRTLLDVLSAEVALINGVSDLVATEADAAIASLTLLQAMGVLSLDAVQAQPIDQVLPRIPGA